MNPLTMSESWMQFTVAVVILVRSVVATWFIIIIVILIIRVTIIVFVEAEVPR